MQVPLAQDLGPLVDSLREDTNAEVHVSSLDGNAVISLRARASSQEDARRIEHDLRLRAHRVLRNAGVFS